MNAAVLFALIVCAAVAVHHVAASPTERYGRDRGLHAKPISPPYWNYLFEGRGNMPRRVRVARSDRDGYADHLRALGHREIIDPRDLSTRYGDVTHFPPKPAVPLTQYRLVCHGTREDPRDGPPDGDQWRDPLSNKTLRLLK